MKTKTNQTDRRTAIEWQLAALGGTLVSLSDFSVSASFPFGSVELTVNPLMSPERIGNLFHHEVENAVFA